jgi:NAD(P)H-nitrite reductase large subunit
MTRERLVVVGFGMAAVRLIEDLTATGALGPDGRYDLTVVGEEPHLAYNRVLLSAVLEGTSQPEATVMRSRAWYELLGVNVVTGRRVVEIDRAAGEVELEDGERLPYDRLVLALGGSAVLPPVRGAITRSGELHPKVVAFRTLDDCERLLETIAPGQTAVVIGGGLLGLEAARGLVARGLTVDVVEVAEHLLSTQLEPEPAKVLRRAVSLLGIGVHCGVRAVALAGDETCVTGVRLDDRFVLSADVVVLACGVRPRIALAREAGLEVGAGIVVDDRLRSVTDERIHALGDCAEYAGVVPGLVGPAWEQAAVLARFLGGDGSAAYTGARIVTRLRASDLDVAVLGSVESVEGDDVVEYANPLRGVYRRLVIRAGRLSGAVLVGQLDGIGLLVQYFDRQDLLPDDPLYSLLGDTDPDGEPLRLPDEATVCQCNNVCARAVREAAAAGAETVTAIATRTRATTGCGGCVGAVALLLREVAEAGCEPHTQEVGV